MSARAIRRRTADAEQARRGAIAARLAAWDPATLTAVHADKVEHLPLFTATVQAGPDQRAGESRG